MHVPSSIACSECPLKCDICLTAREMGMEVQLRPFHVAYKRRQIICRQGSLATHVVVLLGGNAKMYIDGINHRNIILNILLPSNYIGLMSVIGSPAYSFSVAALNSCHTCHVDMALVRTMYYGNQNFMKSLNQAFTNSVTSIMSKLISLNQKQVRGKVSESLLYLSRLYDAEKFPLTLSRKELGELSAISEENVVRVLTEYRNEGIIILKGRMIELKEMETLRRISAGG